ncbi:MAG: hypothetical protein IT204_11680 [Fimbriimonadaceae bacterium]|nr:hypothetical protein [Fimbriimonadaceae bacterium]
MGSFFDRFKDFDGLKAQAEDLLEQGLAAGRRQAALAKLKVRLYDLDRRMNAEFRVLGEKVWEQHEAGSLSADSLSGAFAVLEAVSDEMEDAKEELQDLLRQAKDGAAEAAEAAERRLEPEPPRGSDRAPLE